jgi:hypothetical protein
VGAVTRTLHVANRRVSCDAYLAGLGSRPSGTTRASCESNRPPSRPLACALSAAGCWGAAPTAYPCCGRSVGGCRCQALPCRACASTCSTRFPPPLCDVGPPPITTPTSPETFRTVPVGRQGRRRHQSRSESEHLPLAVRRSPSVGRVVDAQPPTRHRCRCVAAVTIRGNRRRNTTLQKTRNIRLCDSTAGCSSAPPACRRTSEGCDGHRTVGNLGVPRT